MMPFVGGVYATANGTLILSAAAALLYASMVSAMPRLVVSVMRPLAIALLGVLAFLEGGSVWLLLALAMATLTEAVRTQDRDDLLLPAVGLAALAQIAAAGLFASLGTDLTRLLEPWRMGFAVAGATIVLAFAVAVLMRTRSARLPVVLFALATIAMLCAALAQPRLAIVAGAALLAASGIAFLAERFLVAAISPSRPALHIAAWAAAYLAQATIALALLTLPTG